MRHSDKKQSFLKGARMTAQTINRGTAVFFLGALALFGCKEETKDELSERIVVQDETVSTAPRTDGPVFSTAVAGNYQFIIGGDFKKVGGHDIKYLAKVDRHGRILDPFVSNLGDGPNGPVKSVLRLEDGRVILAGEFTMFNLRPAAGIICLNSDGTRNSECSALFGEGVATGTIDRLRLIGGKVIIMGEFSEFDGQSASGIVQITL